MKTARDRKAIRIARLEGWVSLIINTILFALKYWAGIVSGSVALMADAWHTLSDSITSVMVLVGNRISEKPPDRQHPFGHGRMELIAALMIGVFLGIVAFQFGLESFHRLADGTAAHFGRLAVTITAVSVILKELLAQFAIRAGRKYQRHSVIADGWHHRSDAISSAVVLAGIFLGKRFWWMDSVMGFAVSMLLFHATYTILRDSISPLIGEDAPDDLVSRIKTIAGSVYPEDIHSHHIHIHQYGDHTEVTMHIHLPATMLLQDAHDIACRIERALDEELNMTVTIHMEPDTAVIGTHDSHHEL